jgi:hypothetical protein
MQHPKEICIKYQNNFKIWNKFNCSNANAAIHGKYYFLRIYTATSNICIYIEILPLNS